MSSPGPILYDGDDFVLHYRPGTASHLLVTFVGANQEGIAARDFLASGMANKYDIPCLGITCKTRHMYTSAEMDRVIEAAAPVLRRYQTVVTIGNSIGAYAAIKFSRRFGATHVLAVAPAYSLDVDELVHGNAAERLSFKHHNFNNAIPTLPSFKGMAIRASDVSGRIVVLHNPHSPIDVFQMRHLRASIAIEEVPMQHEGHNVYGAIERAETMSKVVDALRFSDSTELRRAFRTIRHSSPSCIAPVLQRAMVRHPLLVDRALRSNAVIITPGLKGLDHGILSNELCFRLAECGHEAPAYERLERAIRRTLGQNVDLVANHEPGGTARLRAGRQYLLLSSHGSFLCATTTAKLVLNWNPFSTEGLTPVFASLSEDGLVLRTSAQDGRLSAPLPTEAGQSVLAWSRQEGRIVLGTEAGVLSAQKDDTITFSSGDAERRGQFLPVAVEDPARFIQRRNTDWLDTIAQRVPDQTGGPTRRSPVRSQSTGAGWNRLLKLVGRGG